MAGASCTFPFLQQPHFLDRTEARSEPELSAMAPKPPALSVSKDRRERRTLGKHEGSPSQLVWFVWEEGISIGWQGKEL